MPCLLTHVVWIGVVMWLGRERVGVKDVVDLRAQLQERAVASTTPGGLDQLGCQLRLALGLRLGLGLGLGDGGIGDRGVAEGFHGKGAHLSFRDFVLQKAQKDFEHRGASLLLHIFQERS